MFRCEVHCLEACCGHPCLVELHTAHHVSHSSSPPCPSLRLCARICAWPPPFLCLCARPPPFLRLCARRPHRLSLRLYSTSPATHNHVSSPPRLASTVTWLSPPLTSSSPTHPSATNGDRDETDLCHYSSSARHDNRSNKVTSSRNGGRFLASRHRKISLSDFFISGSAQSESDTHQQ
uniref:Uncharacterized protein n=1 Tax=Zea mays TaxID=4577 RepID=A0A804PXF0_MAIZE